MDVMILTVVMGQGYHFLCFGFFLRWLESNLNDHARTGSDVGDVRFLDLQTFQELDYHQLSQFVWDQTDCQSTRAAGLKKRGLNHVTEASDRID
jgi:hypothetical protein